MSDTFYVPPFGPDPLDVVALVPTGDFGFFVDNRSGIDDGSEAVLEHPPADLPAELH